MAKISDRERQLVIKDCVKGSDAFHSAFQRAAYAGDLDLAKKLRDHVRKTGDLVAEITRSTEAYQEAVPS